MAPSRVQIHWRDEEGHSGLFTHYVLDNLLFNLWGRNVLEGVVTVLCSPNSMVSYQMFQQGYNPLRDWENINKAGYILYNL
jgi:hypothetical protein